MPATVILGGHWGDEGKGKVIDLLAANCSYNVRYSGGANAGHTVVNEHGSFALHQVPSGVFHPGVVPMLAAGVVVDPQALLEEIATLRAQGVSLDRLHVSERAHLVMPYHKALDTAMEARRGERRLGTTGKGIGPAYSDKAARDGLRVGDMLDRKRFAELVRQSVEAANRQLVALYGAEPVDAEHVLDQSEEWARQLGPYICDVERELRYGLSRGQMVLLEGAQGALLDIDAGSYPYVTSSSTGVAGACASAGIPVQSVGPVVAALHAYMTRVGEGPFPTEQENGIGEHLRVVGKEFGTTTGRARRCGWFDAAASRYIVDLNGVTSLAITKLDILDGLDPLKLCVGYEIDGKIIDYVPARPELLFRAEPVYEELPGWQGRTTPARTWEELPDGARAYVRRIEELMGVPVSIISVGPARDETIILRDPLSM
ncbi:MAG: adenylosuccinate synthase [Chloroflexota bacterium]|nr:adenylosuccinate synthase [Chloroflexota bacterium]